jgi:hypothetical protein
MQVRSNVNEVDELTRRRPVGLGLEHRVRRYRLIVLEHEASAVVHHDVLVVVASSGLPN